MTSSGVWMLAACASGDRSRYQSRLVQGSWPPLSAVGNQDPMSAVPKNEYQSFSARSEQAALNRSLCETIQLVR